jgi:hypothetical protein
LKGEQDQVVFSVHPVEGSRETCPASRTYSLKFYGIQNPDTCHLSINRQPAPVSPLYDPETKVLSVTVDTSIAPGDQVVLNLTRKGGIRAAIPDHNSLVLETCKALVKKFRMESYAKRGIMDYLPAILQDPSLLNRIRPSVSGAQLRALLETITRTGVHRSCHTGEDFIEMWNQNPLEDTFPITYHLTVNQLHYGYYDHPFHYESGPVPAYKVFYPAKQCFDFPWELRIKYGDVLTVRYSSELDKPKHKRFELI